jgi:hypothetical protein
VIHLASPFMLGAHGVTVARRLGVPAVAVYQTDMAAFLRRYGLRGTQPATWRWLAHIHHRAALTLAPSLDAARVLAEHGIAPVKVWARGVDHLAALRGLPGCRVMVVGDGPLRRQLQGRLPEASFLGFKTGQELATVVASSTCSSTPAATRPPARLRRRPLPPACRWAAPTSRASRLPARRRASQAATVSRSRTSRARSGPARPWTAG